MTMRSWLRHVAEKKELVLNCQESEDGLVWWSSRRKWAAGGEAKLQSSWLLWQTPKPSVAHSSCKTGCKSRTFASGAQFSLVLRPVRSLRPYWTDDPWQVGAGTFRQCMRCCGTPASGDCERSCLSSFEKFHVGQKKETETHRRTKQSREGTRKEHMRKQTGVDENGYFEPKRTGCPQEV